MDQKFEDPRWARVLWGFPCIWTWARDQGFPLTDWAEIFSVSSTDIIRTMGKEASGNSNFCQNRGVLFEKSLFLEKTVWRIQVCHCACVQRIEMDTKPRLFDSSCCVAICLSGERRHCFKQFVWKSTSYKEKDSNYRLSFSSFASKLLD